MIIEKPLYPQRVTVWCGFWAGGIIGLYLFENEAKAAVLVNGLRHQTTINGFLWPELEDMDVHEVHFQEDGATCHTTGETISFLREKMNRKILNFAER